MTVVNDFHRLAKEYFDFVHRTYPTWATYLGVPGYDDQLEDYSGASIKRTRLVFSGFQERFSSFKKEVGSLNLSDRIDFQLLESDLFQHLFSLEKFKDWERNPNLYVETPLVGIFLLLTRARLSPSQKFKAVISRLKLYPRFLRTGEENLAGVPPVYRQIALETLNGSRLFVGRLKISFPYLTRDQRRQLGQAQKRALAALKSFQLFLENDRPQGAANFAIGSKNFEALLKKEHHLNLTAAAVLKIGRQNFKRINREMEDLAVSLSGQKNWQKLVQEYRTHVPPAHKLLESYRREVSNLKRFLTAKDLVTFPPGERCLVAETPAFERPTVPYAAYLPPGPFEKDQTGLFWVTPIDRKPEIRDQKSEIRDQMTEQLREHNLFAYKITALHEAYPGHHLQFSLANRHFSFIRKHGQSSLFCEGWALYCEQMMGEAGYYKDERVRLFVLKDELWRAARVMIDVGLHCRGMTVGRAVDLLVKKVRLARAQALAEVRRYTLSPTQPLSYLLGKMEILKLREKAKKRWGRNFSLKAFHDRLLSAGTIPPALAAREVLKPL